MNITLQQIIKILKSKASKKKVLSIVRFGNHSKNILGVDTPFLRQLAKKIGKNHQLALSLWRTGIHEAMILASMIAEKEKLTIKQANKWVKDFDSWGVCDQACSNLFSRASFAHQLTYKWVKDKREYVRRAGFALMATLAVHDKKSADSVFIKYFPVIKKYSTDERNFVRKAVNWALRQIGKRNQKLRKHAIMWAKEIQKINSKSAKWVAGDALRELVNRS